MCAVAIRDLCMHDIAQSSNAPVFDCFTHPSPQPLHAGGASLLT